MNAASATIDELKQQIIEVRRDVTAEADERLAARLAALTAEHERVLSAVVAKRDALQHELDETRSAAGETETRLNTRLMSTLAARETERSSSEATIASLTRRIDEVRTEVTADLEQKFGAQLSEAIADLDRERASVEATIASLTHQIEEGKRAVQAEAEERYETQLALAEAEHERTLREAVERARQETRDEKSAQIARLEHSIRGLDGSRTLVTALEELGRAASREVDRVAVLVLKAGRLQGWRVFGFASNGAGGIDLDVGAAGIAGDTVRSGAVSTGARLPEFARDAVERHGMAFPITVGWAVVAVLYADAPRATGDPQRWSGALEVLSRHASKVLEATTLQQAVGLFPPGGGPAAERMVEAAHVQAG
jgi:hypothetical protein